MRRSRIGIKKRQKKINIGVALFFLIILPIIAITIGQRITQLWVVPTISTSDILKPPLENDLEIEHDSEGPKEENVDLQTNNNKLEIETETIYLNPISIYMIQIASLSDSKNIDILSEELKGHEFPHIIYGVDNLYKIYTFASTRRNLVEEQLNKVREVYNDAYISEIYIPQKQINYSTKENVGTKEIVKDINSLISLLDQSSEALYKFTIKEGKLEDYREVLFKHEELLKELSKKVNKANRLPNEFVNTADIIKMIDYHNSNISKSLEVSEENNSIYILHNQFLDNLFRTIEIFNK